MITESEAWEILEEQHWVSDETLRVVTAINWYSVSTLEDILYAVAWERSFEEEEEEEDDDI